MIFLGGGRYGFHRIAKGIYDTKTHYRDAVCGCGQQTNESGACVYV